MVSPCMIVKPRLLFMTLHIVRTEQANDRLTAGRGNSARCSMNGGKSPGCTKQD